MIDMSALQMWFEILIGWLNPDDRDAIGEIFRVILSAKVRGAPDRLSGRL
jgi:hypothetical protein